MKLKMFLCFFMILMCIASFSFVSAQDSDVNDTNFDLDESISSEESLSVSSNWEDNLSSSTLTFSDLASSIASTDAENTLNLDNNYTYVNSSDNKYSNGIGISKSITINGNGNVIDGNFESKIFDISSSNLVLKNIIFKNGLSNLGSALYIRSNAHVDIINCTFENNVANNGVVFIENDAYANISNSTFKGNFLDKYGVIYSYVNSSFSVSDSVFKDNVADLGVIMVSNQSYCNISSSAFVNNTVKSGVIFMNVGSNGNIYECIFENHTVDKGIVYLSNYFNGSVYSCNFTNNYANYGILYRGSDSYSYIKNCIFYDNEAYQGIIYSPKSSDGDIELCIFQNNFASTSVIFKGSNSNGNITDCVFDGNAAYDNIIQWFNPDYNYIMNCEFYSNQAAGNGIVNFYGGCGVVCNSYFEDNYAYDGIVYVDNQGYLFIYNCEFDVNEVVDRGIIFVSNASLCAVGYESLFYNNAAKYGIIYFAPNSYGLIEDSYFISNIAFNGPAIFSLNAEVDINNTNFTNNTAIFSGGSIYFMYGNLSINNSQFLNNTAVDGGAICGDNYNSFTAENTDFINNTAYRYGEAIAILFKNSLTNSSCYFENNDIHFISLLEILNITSNAYSLINQAQSNITSIPSYYNLVDYGYVTPIKNQGADGNCWSFAAMAALESALLKNFNLSFDLSENNLKNLAAYFSDYGSKELTNKGGYPTMVLNYFSSWLGPVNESDDQYFDDNGLFSNLLSSIIHVQDIMYVPRDNVSDLNSIKEALMKYGAVAISIYWDEDYINGASVYCPNNLTINHAVTIVGWNDTYSKNNFLETPPGDGAWIIKNSWGEDSGDNGYYYVSYYDISCALSETNKNFVFIFNSTVNYDNIYQYEFGKKTMITWTEYVVNNTIWGKNVFTAKRDEHIAGISSIFDIDTDYEVSIYVNHDGVDELKLTQNGTAHAGYHTIELNKFISVQKGDVFSVVIKYIADGNLPVFSNSVSNREFNQTGVSYASYDGKLYSDVSKWGNMVCIKAFTVEKINSTINLISINPVEVENSFNIVAIVLDQYGNPVNGGNVTFNINDAIYVLNVTDGVANLTVSMNKSGLFNIYSIFNASNYYTSNTSLMFTVFKHQSDLTIDVCDIDYNNGLTVNVTVSYGASGYVTIKIDDEHSETALINNSKASYTFNNLKAGNYTVHANYSGDALFNSSYNDTSFKVNKISSNVIISDILDMPYGEAIIIPFTITDGVSGDVSISIYKDDVLIANKTVDASLNCASFSNLNVSDYIVVVKYLGDNNYFSNNSSSVFKVYKSNSSISVNSFANISYSEDIIFSFTLVNGTNVSYQLNYNDVVYDSNWGNNSLKFSNLSAGTYTLFVENNGNDNHNPSNITFNFSVYKINSELIINQILQVTYPDDVNISYSISPKTKSNVKISIYQNNVLIANKTVDTGESSVVFSNLASGDYNISVEYLDNINFTDTLVNTTFTINKASSDVLINQFENITYGNNLTITSTLIDGKEGSYEIIFNNTVIKSGAYLNQLIFNNLDAANYTLIIYNAGDLNHKASNKSINFTVEKLTPTLSINDISDIVYGNNVVILFNANIVGDFNVSIYKNHQLISTKVVSGNSAIFDNLSVGNYNVNVKNMGDKNHYGASTSSDFTVVKANSSIAVDPIDNITFGENLSVNIEFINGSGSYELICESDTIKKGNESAFSLNKLDCGDYTLNVYNIGDLNHNESFIAINFSVFKANSTLDINEFQMLSLVKTSLFHILVMLLVNLM